MTILSMLESMLTAKHSPRNESERKLTEYTWGDYDSVIKRPWVIIRSWATVTVLEVPKQDCTLSLLSTEFP